MVIDGRRADVPVLAGRAPGGTRTRHSAALR
ncbi:hypothetical protein FHU30_001744 [Actinomadura rupiterrae]|nr:hypothetical protein [Actinomadura rupiterrae]